MMKVYKISTTNSEGKVISEVTLKYCDDLTPNWYGIVGNNIGQTALAAIRDDYNKNEETDSDV